MATGFDIGQLKSFLECSICLEQFDNPKTLSCSHDFCKECLEDIINFNADGSAIITCPMRCPVQTHIANNKTVNNLATSYNFKSMLEALKIDQSDSSCENPQCRYVKNCKKEVSFHCCEILMCKSCHVKHEKSTAHGQTQKVNLLFSKRENKLHILCEEHASKCTHLCVDNKFLCIYCLQRDKDHAKHAKNTIGTEVALIKQVLLNDSNEKKDFGSKFLSVTEQNMVIGKEKFDELLLQRKGKCLAHYNNFLNEEEEMLKNKFQGICNTHLKQYQFNITPKYYEEKLNKGDVELVIEKEAILNTISTSKNKNLNIETISVCDHLDFRSEHPLGDIAVTVGEEVAINSQPMPTLTFNIELDDEESGLKQESEKGMLAILSKLVDDYERKLDVLRAQIDKSSKGNYKGKVDILTEENSMPRVQIDAKSEGETKILMSPSNKKVQAFLDITIGNIPAGRIIMNLFDDIVPKTCKNFVQLCTHEQGFGYKGNKFHFVDPNYACSAGDITLGKGTGGRSIYGDKFECENFVKKHDGRGIVSMKSIRNRGEFTRSVFFIYIEARPGVDGRQVVFAKVTDETYFVVEKIMAVQTSDLQQPKKEILIVDCGVL